MIVTRPSRSSAILDEMRRHRSAVRLVERQAAGIDVEGAQTGDALAAPIGIGTALVLMGAVGIFALLAWEVFA